MPKNEQKLQRETNLPFDPGRAGGQFVPRTSEYPNFKGTVVRTPAKEGMTPATSKAKFRGSYDEQHGVDENLGMKFVKPNAFDSKSTQSFKK